MRVPVYVGGGWGVFKVSFVLELERVFGVRHFSLTDGVYDDRPLYHIRYELFYLTLTDIL